MNRDEEKAAVEAVLFTMGAAVEIDILAEAIGENKKNTEKLLYKALLDENTKLWYSSTLSLYEALEKEKTEQKKVQKDNPKILLFQMFCAENYRETKNISAKETLLLFSNHGVFEFLYENFEMLHTQDTEYILDTIITYINKKA